MILNTVVHQVKTPSGPRIRNSDSIPPSLLALREALCLSKPEYWVAPTWFAGRVSALVREGLLPKPEFRLSGWFPVDFAARHFGRRWLDHAGRLRIAGQPEYLVAEPYNLMPQAMQDLENFGFFMGLNYSISSRSWWYPGCTVRITFWPGKFPFEVGQEVPA